MAIRNIRTLGDEILRKKAKEVTEMTPRIQELIDDMFEQCMKLTESDLQHHRSV